MQFLAENPHLGKVFRKMIQQGIQDDHDRRSQAGSNQAGESSPKNQSVNSPTMEASKRGSPQIIKSPSDTTIYVPALHKINEADNAEEIMDKVSNFVESMRIENQHKHFGSSGKQRDRQHDRPISKKRLDMSTQQHSHEGSTPNQEREAAPHPEIPDDQAQARQKVVEAELFDASVEPPKKGNVNLFLKEFSIMDRIKRNESDDDIDNQFFHLTCHVDSTLKDKIERGE